MRLGISTSLEHTSPEDWARKQKELGMRAVVFPVNCEAGDAVIDAYVAAAKAADLAIAEVGVWKNTMAADPEEREAALTYAINQLKMADRIGAACCVNIVGTAGGPVWDGGYRENFLPETWDEAVKMIQYIIDEAQPVHTVYAIEPMPWMYPTGPDEYLKLIQAVDRKNFAVHMDLVNMINSTERYFFMDEFIDECFDKIGDLIVSCHLKDIHMPQELTFQLREAKLGEGELKVLHYLDRIEKANPDMPVIIEHLTTDQEYKESVQYLNTLLANG